MKRSLPEAQFHESQEKERKRLEKNRGSRGDLRSKEWKGPEKNQVLTVAIRNRTGPTVQNLPEKRGPGENK